MKKILFITSLALFISCSKSADFSKMKVGMTTNDLINLLGEPEDKTDLFGAEIWMYKDGKTGHLITIINDTVAGFKGGSELEESLKDINSDIEELDKTIREGYEK